MADRSGTNTRTPRRASTASRGASSGRRSITIDAHTHVAVPRAAEFIKPHLDVSTIPLAHFASAETKELNAKQEADIRSRMTGITTSASPSWTRWASTCSW